jgi:hypothetical protein
MHRDIGRIPFESIDAATKQQLQQDIDRAMNILRDHVTVEAVHQRMRYKYDHHNQIAAADRETMKEKNRIYNSCTRLSPCAANQVTLDTRLRSSTQEEKELVAGQCTIRSPRGLHVCNEIYDSIMRILHIFKDNSGHSFTMRDFTGVKESGGVCDLTLLSFARLCVEQGALTIVKV